MCFTVAAFSQPSHVLCIHGRNAEQQMHRNTSVLQQERATKIYTQMVEKSRYLFIFVACFFLLDAGLLFVSRPKKHDKCFLYLPLSHNRLMCCACMVGMQSSRCVWVLAFSSNKEQRKCIFIWLRRVNPFSFLSIVSSHSAQACFLSPAQNMCRCVACDFVSNDFSAYVHESSEWWNFSDVQ